MYHSPEIFGVGPNFVGEVASHSIFIRALVFSGLLDHRQKICNNCVVGDFLASKIGVCYAFVEAVDEFFNSFVRRPVVEEFCCVFDVFSSVAISY